MSHEIELREVTIENGIWVAGSSLDMALASEIYSLRAQSGEAGGPN